ncbi:zinc-binding alcohol dehydrogenase family protein [Mucilaginibacter sabulilitoris]|uniref:Zinc-binding alcohol dehydrogenase family protein n=1 Tax=Mucilaginibacter sabulilitoris TaxID=1173583 RepID=A0ABZ0TTL4_9SPHI|nr:zinc-binding alcohol dehydrogenase family protein [Mucilaginibacter sabulilitoris]WPU96331.1 zinc-binding alcohol dehydrogenase family protein [Mucilaginibacter sabulilitoris]
MKAAVITKLGDIPQYKDFQEPAAGEGGTLIDVKASVLENFDKVTVNGTHYSSKKLFPQFPAIAGTDGVGMTEDGRLVSFGDIKRPYGAFAEKTIAGYTFPVPDGIDAASAAAIPPSVLTSLLPLKYSAKLQPGETVLINGATGVSGRIAVQVAKLLGAGKVVGTGRNEDSLKLLSTLGADEVINLQQPDNQLAEAFTAAAGENGYDVVIDFLWGHPAEVLMNTFIPGEAGFAKRRIRYIQIGEKAGSSVSLTGSALRTSGLELMGIGKIPNEVLADEISNVWNWMKEGKFYMDIERVPLSAIAEAWQRDDLAGKRLVIIP